MDTTFVVSPEGLVTSATQGALTTTYDYDAAMRLAAVNPPASNPITYQPDDLNGTFVRVRRGDSMVEHVVDGFGREILTSNSQFLKVERQRDTCGRVVFTSDPFTATGPGAGTQGTSVQYDALGRVKQTTDSAGKVTTLTYSGAGLSRTDANNRTTVFDYMAFGDPANAQLASVTDATGQVTGYRYDVTGALARVLGPGPGLQRTWTIGVKGLPDSDTQPESGTTVYTYDAVGNLASILDANNQTTTFTYDGSNRLTLRDAPGTDDDLAITYDTTGRIATLSSGGTTTTFSYNVPARQVTRTDQTPAGTFTSVYKTDANDNLSELTYPSGRIVTYHFDAENRLTSFDHTPPGTSIPVPFATSFLYGDDGRLASYTTGAVTHNFTYEFNRTRRLWTTGGSDALDLTYAYDNVGNVAAITDPRPNANQTFVPDPLDRLESATGPWGTLQWQYDAAGNRLSEVSGSTTTSYTYSAATQRLTGTSGGASESFGYDGAGRLTSDGVGQYSYSPTGKLTGATGTGVNASYTYDASGERFSKTVNGQTTYSLRSVGGQTLTEYLGSCGAMIWSRDLLYAGGQLIGAAKATTVQPSVAMVAAGVTVNEGAGTASVSVRLTTPNGAALGCPVTVSYATTAGTATAGADFTQTTGSVTFSTGAASGSTQAISIPIVNDSTDEPDEGFSVGLSSATGAAIQSPTATTITVLDDDPPQVWFAASSSSVGEGGSASVVVTLATAVPLPSAVSVSYATGNGSAAAGQDYTASSGAVSFGAGSTNGATQTITVPIGSDSTFEGNETFAVSLSAPSGALLVSPSTHTVTIADDDLPTVSFSASSSSVGEAGSSTSVTVTLGTGIALPSAVSVVYTTANGSAVSGSDYGGVSGTVTFGAGSTNGATQSISVPIYADSLFEGSESFSVSLSSPSGAWIVSPSGHTVTIVDDDLPTIAFSAASSSAGEAAGSVSVTVTLGTGIALPSAVSASFATGNGSAASGADYSASSGTVSFGAGSGNGATQSIVVSLIDDGLYEGNETFSLSLYSPSGATIIAPSGHTVTILENEPVPNPIITLEAPPNGAVGASAVTIGGWAIDANAPSGTGITAVNVYAYPNADESQPAIFLGSAPYGGWRGDVASSYGGQFGPSGFTMGATLPGPGVYRVRAFGYDPLGGTWYPSNPRDFTVQPTPRMNIDTPAPSGSVAAWFPVQGWAIDAGAGSGTGVDTIHVYAYPNPGSGQPAIFLGAATYGGYRSDVAATFGSQFGNSGFGLTANLGAGYYQVVVYAHSTVTASWSQAQSAYVTVVTGVQAAIDAPGEGATVGQPFGLTGWALDASSSSGNGVPFLHVYVYLYGATPQFLGAPSTVAGSRPDLGAWLQASRFNDSGWGLTVSGLPAGTHLLVVYPYSSVTGGFAPALLRWVTVQ